MTAYAAGDAQAFEMLYQRHKGALFRYFARQLPTPEAHDCYQNLWLKIIGHRSRYAPSGSFRSYLFSLAHNVLMDHHRHTMRRPAGDSEQLDVLMSTDGEPQQTREREELIEHLHRLVRALPIHQREAWLLRQETELSTREIASITETSEEGIKSRLRYARAKLKAGMARYAQRN
jgi:RNA polymerase sigma-70 factor (ECF subfamily)